MKQMNKDKAKRKQYKKQTQRHKDFKRLIN